MPYRPGAGRPRGSRDLSPRKRRGVASKAAVAAGAPTVITAAAARDSGLLPEQTPLSFLLSVMRDATADPARRDRCAIAALPYLHRRPGDTPVRAKAAAAAAAAEQAKTGRYAMPPPPLRLVPGKLPDKPA